MCLNARGRAALPMTSNISFSSTMFTPNKIVSLSFVNLPPVHPSDFKAKVLSGNAQKRELLSAL